MLIEGIQEGKTRGRDSKYLLIKNSRIFAHILPFYKPITYIIISYFLLIIFIKEEVDLCQTYIGQYNPPFDKSFSLFPHVISHPKAVLNFVA